MTTNNDVLSDHVTVTLGRRTTRPLQVVAATSDGRRGGNMLVSGPASITWLAEGEVDAYVLTFYDLKTGQAVWPFEGKPDGDGATGPLLRVTRDGVTRTLLPSPTLDIKYEVAAENSSGEVAPLDPMIIIRPPSA